MSLRSDRQVILSDTGNFPTDLYIAQGICEERGKKLKLVEPEAAFEAIDENVSVLMLTQVDYRTGRKHNMKELTKKAHEQGALVLWDLAHSAGAFPVDLAEADADFAVGCGYKYLNGGPGAPAFIYVKKELQDNIGPALQGWMGHDAPFAFDLDYKPATGMHKMLVGTPSIIGMSVLDSALDIWEEVTLDDVWAQSKKLSSHFIDLVEAKVSSDILKLVSPRDPEARGSQVSFAFDNGYAAIQALIAKGIIGDFRAPNIMRFGFTPLYLDEEDVEKAAEVLIRVIIEREWDQPQFLKKAKVT